MTFNELANKTCEHLPEEWEIVISLENGCGVVNLYSPEGDNHIEDATDITNPLEEQVLQAIAYAKSTINL